ncbi:hypothetical protein Droror1_Dr00011634 [Drosera rotundifolia]
MFSTSLVFGQDESLGLTEQLNGRNVAVDLTGSGDVLLLGNAIVDCGKRRTDRRLRLRSLVIVPLSTTTITSSSPSPPPPPHHLLPPPPPPPSSAPLPLAAAPLSVSPSLTITIVEIDGAKQSKSLEASLFQTLVPEIDGS